MSLLCLDDRILLRLIPNEILFIACIFFFNAMKTSLDAGCFVQDDVVSHRLGHSH